MSERCNCKNNFCEKYNKELPERHFKMCQGTSGLSREKEEWYLDYYYGTPQPPNTLVKIKNFAVAITEHALSGMANVSEEEYQKRIAICKDCPFVQKNNDNLTCTKCGCRMNGNLVAKARWASQDCPEKKWPKV